MAANSTTALDLIVGALRKINALAAGETPSAQDSSDALQVLNDMLELWSIDHLMVYASVENILSFTAGQYQYTVGNPVAGTITGTLTGGSTNITGVTIPANVVVGATLDDNNVAIPTGTSVAALPGGGVITMTVPATVTPVPNPEPFTYTTPGNFKIPRPLAITNAFTRITASGSTGLDYQIEIINRDKYTAIGLKGLNGPWPIALYYDPTYPLGNLYFYPNPSQPGVLHLWTDTILSDFNSLTNAINLPQGYVQAIKTNLALWLAPEYGKTVGALLAKQAADSLRMVKSLNEIPTVTAFYDRDLTRVQRQDAGWIMHGGFN
jgi:hypothetical protein